MQIFTVERLESDEHWTFLASFVNRLDLIEFTQKNRTRTRIMCGDRLILNLHKHVPPAMTKYDLSAIIWDLTASLVPVAS